MDCLKLQIDQNIHSLAEKKAHIPTHNSIHTYEIKKRPSFTHGLLTCDNKLTQKQALSEQLSSLSTAAS
eukprot:scaffold171572_cov17-Tisochrysis_lutea.AAC.2